MGDLLGHFKFKTAVNCNKIFGTVQIYYGLMLSTHTVAYKIKEVRVNIPFSFLDVLCSPVLFFVGFQEVAVGKECHFKYYNIKSDHLHP